MASCPMNANARTTHRTSHLSAEELQSSSLILKPSSEEVQSESDREPQVIATRVDTQIPTLFDFTATRRSVGVFLASESLWVTRQRESDLAPREL